MPAVREGRELVYRCDEPGCRGRSAGIFEGLYYCAEHLNLKTAAVSRLVVDVSPPPVVRPDCSVCGNRRFVVSAGAQLVEARPCPACDVACPRCQGKGLYLAERYGYDTQVACECGRTITAGQVAALAHAQLPAVYASELFGKLPPRTLTETQRAVQMTAYQWAQRYTTETRQGLFFSGPPGTGKTLALCRALALLAKARLKVTYVNLPIYLAAKKESFGDGSIEVSALQDLERVDVLLVDEILLKTKGGKPRPQTEWERAQFDALAQARWNAGRPTFYATNYSTKEIEAELSESTWSRIRHSTQALEVQGQDLRERPAAPVQAALAKRRNDHPWQKRGDR